MPLSWQLAGFVVQDSLALSDAQVQLNIDVQFLLRQGLMDYSLLLSVFWLTPEFTGLCPACAVGAIPVKAVDSDRRAFVKFGIIDWLQVRVSSSHTSPLSFFLCIARCCCRHMTCRSELNMV